MMDNDDNWVERVKELEQKLALARNALEKCEVKLGNMKPSDDGVYVACRQALQQINGSGE